MFPARRFLQTVAAFVIFTALALSAAGAAGVASSRPTILTSTSSVRGSNGQIYTVTNHLVTAYLRPDQEYLLVWAGSVNPKEPDFMTVINAAKGSPDYGKVVNTVTFGPQLQNEPHHMQYVWHKGQMIFAGGLLSDTIYVLNPAQLPVLRLVGVNLPMDTPCGTVPDAFQVLKDGTAYGTEMGGPNISGPCTYTNGQVRYGNGYGGSPGEVVHISPAGKTLAEAPTATAAGESRDNCHNIPALPKATCANPHGIAVRQDLHRMITTDFAEVRNYLNPGSQPPSVLFDPHLVRDTVRIWNISSKNNPMVVSVSILPVGPRPERFKVFDENRVVMETSVTNLRRHRGAFVETMWGGAIYYTPDITKPHPIWKEVFDDETAYRTFHPGGSVGSSGDGGAWLAVSPNDKYLFHVVTGIQLNGSRNVTRGMLYVLNIRKLLAAGEHPQCQITTVAQTISGGSAPDCPTLAGVAPIRDTSSGGPHWGAMNNFSHGRWYHETRTIKLVAVANYFAAGLGVDGDHRVCMYNIAANGAPSLDTTFRDEITGKPCVDFNRTSWPQGPTGPARPHGVLFVVPDRDIR